MGTAGDILKAAWFACGVVLWTGCASTEVNPPQARAHRGYVDFYSPGQTNLYWEVERVDAKTGALKPVFSRLKPLPDGILRLEMAPGPQQLQFTFLNRVIEAPLSLQVPVKEGMVTPVKVELVPAGETAVAQKAEQFGKNIRGTGRKTQYLNQASPVERLVASVQPPLPYRPKEQTQYPP